MTITSRYTDIPEVTIDRSKIPEQFESLLPLAKEWSMTDDTELEAYIAAASEAKRKELVNAFIPLLSALGEWHKSCENIEPKPYEFVLFDIAANAADTVQTRISSHATQPPLPPDVAATIPQPTFAPSRCKQQIALCPICGKDDKIQKVSAIVSTHQHSGSSSGSSVGVTYDGEFAVTEAYTNLKTTSISALAKALTPPSEPKKPEGGGCLEGCLFMIVAIPALYIGIPVVLVIPMVISSIVPSSVPKGFVFLCYFICVGVALLLWQAKTKERRDAKRKAAQAKMEFDFAARKNAWGTGMERWNRSYYCHRDGIVFDPITEETCPPEKMSQLLFGHE